MPCTPAQACTNLHAQLHISSAYCIAHAGALNHLPCWQHVLAALWACTSLPAFYTYVYVLDALIVQVPIPDHRGLPYSRTSCEGRGEPGGHKDEK